MMRWGLLGLLALSACGLDNTGNLLPPEPVCPGAALRTEPLAEAPQALAGGRERFLVRYAAPDRVDAPQVAFLGGQVRSVYQQVPALAAHLTPGEHAALAGTPGVVGIEPDLPRYALGWPSLPPQALLHAASRRGSVDEYTPGLNQVQAPAVWDADGDGVLDDGAPTGEGIKVCILDSGIDPAHPELKEAYLEGWDFVEGDAEPWDRTAEGQPGSGHGTHVAGIIAAQLGSDGWPGPGAHRHGVVGVAPGARLLIARVLNTEGRAWMGDILAGLEWCQRQGAHIASLSLGGPQTSPLEQAAFQTAEAHGMLIIAAAGNSGGAMEYPAALPSVLAVGAVDAASTRAPFSCQGGNLALMAPGVDVRSSILTGTGAVSEVALGGTPHASRALFMAPAGHQLRPLVDCGEAHTAHTCLGATCEGFVAYIQRGTVSLSDQLTHVMRQGATAAIIGNTRDEGGLPDLALDDWGPWVPAAVVSHSSGQQLRQRLGAEVDVTLHPSDYTSLTGTSMATPHVAGVAALVWSRRPTLTAAQVRHLLVSAAKDLGPPGKDPAHGHGLVQAKASLDMLGTWP
ncbi:S8 family serine peptidase [Stigmatella aurantiaca]|uniref:Subtilisin J n=1 Tax=Stigmatella aurantiaca (strain DW4/3-1) TaxID=378806 RepID=Q095Q5_STIAD|nr:S8 family serine peptidase [Stigmatella aurantiaca]ADO68363.1 Subtilisin J [Stigmatella aurantiaca DW4/3-1]EAU67425.1 subtilisin J [Stigmatella aurantiaca DW4/3-1]